MKLANMSMRGLPAMGGGLSLPVMDGGAGSLLAASVGINLLALALPIFILQIYDRVLSNQATTTLSVLIAGLSVALILDIALRLARSWVATWNGAKLEHALRCGAVERVLAAPLPRVEHDPAGVHLERFNAIGAVREFHASQLLLTLVDLPFALLFLSLIGYLAGWLVLVPIALLLCFGAVAMAIGLILRASMAERAETDKRRYNFLIEALNGIHTVKALALNAVLLRRYEKLQEASAVAVRNVAYQSGLAQTLGNLFSQLTTTAIVGVGAVAVLDGRMTMGALAACTLLAGRTLQPLQTAMGLWTSFQSVRVARERLDEIMSLPREHQGAMPAILGQVEMTHVTFGHGTGREPLFSGLSLSAKPGEIVGIEGDSGAGKTSLLLLLLGLIEPLGGGITIDGNALGDIDPAWLRRHVAMLSPDGPLFSGTILDNLTDFREGECVNEALYLAFLLGLDEIVKRLPEGFDTRVAAGETLPAGVRQRIALIRELVKQPKIILFDEADSALDADGKKRLATLLRQLGQRSTVILISSNTDLLRLARHRYRLRQGHLIPISAATGKAQVQEVLAR